MEDDCLIQMGASLYGLVNILSYDQYQKFTKHEANTPEYLR
jgi:hypothetical protein